ncbi:MAG: alpha/beta hydrolase [Acholeplasmataceae bacterium]|jgi:pimeloyl-ACP methyl ester carboxylesterase|nr:alpha/beta hydrolase [Acholeplasmataceae bacterium]
MKAQTIKFKDCGIYYTIFQNESKPTIVMIHSYASSGKIFDSQVLALKRLYQLIVVDLPGHGKSQYSKNVKINDMPEVIKLILDRENIAKTHLIGVSEGALVAQAFGQIFSNKILSAVVVSSFSIFHDSYKAFYESQFLTKLKLFFFWLFAFGKYKNYYVEKSALKLQAQTLFAQSMIGFSRRSVFVKKNLKRFYHLGEQKTKYPTYVVCGEFDLGIIKDASLQYEQKVPLTTVEGYNDAKQIVFLDNPRLFNERLKTFFKSVDDLGETDGE